MTDRRAPYDEPKDTMPDAFDRRSANRDAANWIGRRLDETRDQINKIAHGLEKAQADIVVEAQDIRNELHDVKAEVHEIRSTLIKSVPGGDPEAHLKDHLELAVERKEREEAAAESKAFWKDLIRKAKMAAILAAVSLFFLGAAEKLRTFVLGAVSGKTAEELKKGAER